MTDEERANEVRLKVAELNIILASAAMAGLDVDLEVYELKTITPGRYMCEITAKISRVI